MNDSEVSLSNAASMEGARERLMRLFTMSEDMRSVEQKIEARILKLADEFSNSARVSTEIEMGRLVETFTDNRLPCETFDVEEYIEYIATNVVAHSINTASPRYIGHMTSALPFFVRPLGKLMTAINQNLVKMETAKSFSPCERQVMAMMHRLVFNLPDDFYDIHTHRNESTLGMMTTGGTEANLAALWCARNFTLGPKGDFPGISKSGWFAALKAYGYSGAAVVGSKLIHYSFDKAADVLGIGDAGVIRVELDRNHRIDLNELQRTLRKCREERRQILALIGVAGSTDSGTVDPLNDMADVAQEYGIHFHVDAAWGGALLFSDRHRHILSGIERADSVTIDGHKQMYLPMGVGMLLIKNPQLAKVIEKQAQYVVRPGSMDLGRRTWNGSRPATVLFVHAALHIIGKLGYQFLVDQGMSKACYMADVIRRCPEFELLAEPQTNILLYRYLPENFRERAAQASLEETENQYISQVNKQLHKIQRQRGLTFVSRTTSFNNRYGSQAPIIGLRAVIANPLTTHADIDAVLQDQKGIAQQLAFHMSAN